MSVLGRSMRACIGARPSCTTTFATSFKSRCVARHNATAAMPRFDPDDSKAVFAHMSTKELYRAMALFELCTSPALMKAGRATLDEALNATGWQRMVAEPITNSFKRHVFPHFCAGETLDDCRGVAEKLAAINVRVVVDHSKEEDESPERHAFNLSEKTRLLRNVRQQLGPNVAFVPVKVTALVSPALLERLTDIITADSQWRTTCSDLSPKLSASDAAELEAAHKRLGELCVQAAQVRVSLLLDAEQTHRQPAIDYIALRLMREFNTRDKGCVVYNTYQFYLEDARDRLERDLLACQTNHCIFAAKLVRGAYIETEKARSGRVISSLQPSKASTDQAYDSAVALLLREIHAYPNSAAAFIATHNRDSVEKAVALMEDLNIPRNDKHVHIAQIMGMSDNVTAALGLAGYNALKLVLFGNFVDVFPWLLRRLDENADMLGAMATERHLLWKEIERRMSATS